MKGNHGSEVGTLNQLGYSGMKFIWCSNDLWNIQRFIWNELPQNEMCNKNPHFVVKNQDVNINVQSCIHHDNIITKGELKLS